MDEALATALNELKTALSEDARVKHLLALEEQMQSDASFLALARAKDAAENAYNDCLTYRAPEQEEARRAQKALYEAKKALDEHPLAKEYLSAYKAVRELYAHIDDLLFGPYRPKGEHSC